MRRLHFYDRKCARCGKIIHRLDCTGESQVYSPRKPYTLCEPCYLAEDAEIETAGTNKLPEVIAAYERTLSAD